MKKKMLAFVLSAALAVSPAASAIGAEFSDGGEIVTDTEANDLFGTGEEGKTEEESADFNASESGVPAAGYVWGQYCAAVSIKIKTKPNKKKFWRGIDFSSQFDLDGMTAEVTYEDGEKATIMGGAYGDERGNTYGIVCTSADTGEKVTDYENISAGNYNLSIVSGEGVSSDLVPIEIALPEEAPELKQNSSKQCTTTVETEDGRAVAKITTRYGAGCKITSPEVDEVDIYDSEFNWATRSELEDGATYYAVIYTTAKNATFNVEYPSEIVSLELLKEPTCKFVYEGTEPYNKFYLPGGQIKVTYANGTTEILSTEESQVTKFGDLLEAECDWEDGFSSDYYGGHPPVGMYNVYYRIRYTDKEVCVKNVEVKPVEEIPEVNVKGSVETNCTGNKHAWIRLKTGATGKCKITISDGFYINVYQYYREFRSMRESYEYGGYNGDEIEFGPNTIYYLMADDVKEDNVTFTVTSDDQSLPQISEGEISVSPQCVYTGNEVTPAVTIIYAGTKLKEGEDYTVSYIDNIEMGTATAVITGKGKYGGEVVKTFEIVLGKPEITSLTETKDNNVLLKWSEVPGADGYRVLRLEGAEWKVLRDIWKNVYTDGNVQRGATYTYKIVAYTYKTRTESEEKSITISANPTEPPTPEPSMKDISGCEVLFPARVVCTGEELTPSVKVICNGKELKADEDYVVAYENNIDLGTGYIQIWGQGNYTGFIEKTFEIILATPELTVSATDDSHVKLSWTAVPKAQKYRIYSIEESEWENNWHEIKMVSGNQTEYVDQTTTRGGTYSYKICPIIPYTNDDGPFSEVKTVTIPIGSSGVLGSPVLLKAEQVGNTAAIRFEWTNVEGADGYDIYVKSTDQNGEETWGRIARVTDALEYTYESRAIREGVTFSCRMRAYIAGAVRDGYSYPSESKTVTIKSVITPSPSVAPTVTPAPSQSLKTPSISTAAVTGTTSVKLTWKKVTGAERYYIYRSTDGKKWTNIKYTTATNWTDTKLTKGITYIYRLRAYSSKTKPSKYSSYSKTKSVLVPLVLSKPSLTVKKSGTKDVKLTWKKVADAQKYVIYRYDKKKWVKIKTVSSKTLSYTDKNKKKGTTYKYRIRAYSKKATPDKYSAYSTTKSVKR